ncbi:ABC transporter permease subunit [Pseudactinotalea sp. HY160]|nr:ABC transporter permease subunit [Pseudactinotalea sp. HY160]QGH70937.1 ABC transporter permease subunit [Pseudactinotalea sp. HY158]
MQGNWWRMPLNVWTEAVVEWLTLNLRGFFGLVKTVAQGLYDGLHWVLDAPPFVIVALVLTAIAFAASGWKLALGTAISLTVIDLVGQWDNAMESLALTLLASIIALLIGFPLGILAAKSQRFSAFIRPVLDFLQTMPAFVYLIPVVVIFYAGAVSGLVATVIFALAPAVRFTELGIRQVDSEVTEAGHAFGAPPRQILRQIEIPLAMPTIMAGVNQVIMLALSMVVIAGMVGAGGLGSDVYQALTRVQVGLGFEAGLGVVLLAIFLDRVTASLSKRTPVARALRATE